MNKNLTPDKRRRSLVKWLILGQLLYGRHASVVWQGERTCLITAPVFAKTMGMDTSELRKALDQLKRGGYLTALDWGRGFIALTLKEPIDRTPRMEMLYEQARADRRDLRTRSRCAGCAA